MAAHRDTVLMDGTRRVGSMGRGETARVRQVYGSWIEVDRDGYRGWVHWTDLWVVERRMRFRGRRR